MRAACLAFCLLALIAGCSDDPQTTGSTSSGTPATANPSLSITVDQPASHVEGIVNIEVVTDSPERFYGIELRLGDTVLESFTKAPFVTKLASDALPDGPATLFATGILAESAKPVDASLDIELANFAPVLELVSPANAEVVRGSPSKGFVVAPILKATDGNGIKSVWADAGQGMIDLGSGDGAIGLPIPTGTEFPHAPVNVTFYAEDGSGDVTQVEASYTPSNEIMRLSAPVPGGGINRTETWTNGAVAIEIGSNMGYPGGVYTLTGPAIPAPPTLSLSGSRIYARRGNDLILNTNVSNGAKLQRADIAAGTLTELLSLQYDYGAKQAMGFGPIFHSSGRMYSSWIKTDTYDTHLLAFEPDGTPLFDVTYAATTINTPTEEPDGQFLAILTPAQSPPENAWFQRIDATTGNLLPPAWAAPAGGILHRDAMGIITATTTNGPPWGITLSYRTWPNGNTAWSHPIGNGSLIYSKWVDADGMYVLVADYGNGGGTKWQRVNASGAQVLWTPPASTTVSPTVPQADASSIYISMYDSATGKGTMGRLLQNGTLAWTREGYAPAISSSGDVLMKNGSDLELVSIDGMIRWAKPFQQGATIQAAAFHDDLLILAYDTGQDMPFYYEALDAQTGKRVWRYGEGPGSASYARGTVIPVPAWNAVLTTFVPSDAKSISVVGLIP